MLNWLARRLSDRTEGSRAGGETETRLEDDADAHGTRANRATEEDEDVSLASIDASSADGSGSLDSWRDLLDEDEVPKQTIWTELGLQPHEFLAWLVRDGDGQIWQSDLVKTTGWSKSTVSRYLDTLETNGTVERVRIGRQNLVGLPGTLPGAVPASDDPSTRSPSSVAPADSWALEADEQA